MKHQRLKIDIEGIVQGVGFRPFVFQLATRFGLSGSVWNDSRGVTIEAEGEEETLRQFVARIEQEKPPLASIRSLQTTPLFLQKDGTFTIRQSEQDEQRRAQVSPDTFVCADCLRELFDPADRRYHYPFINCTNCGPRFTIVTGVPYDRPLTTMADFSQCPSCMAEYEDPVSRRFHAQPNACPECGPSLALYNNMAERIDGWCIDGTVAALNAGKIVAIKGVGGYHLAVDARNERAVKELRRRKERDEKPFALMVKDLTTVKSFSETGNDEQRLLEGVERPIVLLEKKRTHGLAESIAPNNRYFGIMLPYSPLHYLLLDHFPALVMTSANVSDEPIAFEDGDALHRLKDIADLYLSHNRRIHIRTDDSIARVMADRPLLIRRSRGYVPGAIQLPEEVKAVLAVGAELKNTVCMTRGDQAYLSQHIGDLKNLESYDSFRESITHLKSILGVEPECVAHDLHPDYDSSRYAREECHLPAIAVQHHHAHLASCLAEHGLNEQVIGIIFDGIGYGEDGHVWGGEFLVGDLQSCERLGHFKYQNMPGGDLATKQPWRMALSYLMASQVASPLRHPVFKGISENELNLVSQAIVKGINTPYTSSCGRLFDAVSAMLCLRQTVSFEGQAAMELEMVADRSQRIVYPYTLSDNGGIIFEPSGMIRAILSEYDEGVEVDVIAGRFHFTLAAMVTDVCLQIQQRTGLNKVVLSGGVFQNCLLTELCVERLENAGVEVLTHSLVPPNDGGLSLGQAAIAAAR